MAEVNTDIYKPNPNSQPMNPLQVLQMMSGINQLKLFEQTYKARENIGQAYRDNVRPDGTIDQQGLHRDIGQGGGFLAGEATGTAISNTGSQFDVQARQQRHAQELFGTLADMPNPTRADVLNHAVKAIRNTNIPESMALSLINGVPDDPKEIKKFLVTQRNLALGSAAAAGVPATPTEGGAATTQTAGQAGYERAGVGGQRTGNPPGLEAAAVASAGVKAADLAKARQFGTDIYPMTQALGNLERLGITGTGPGTDELNVVKSFIQTNASWLPEALRPDPAKIKDFDEAKKYLTQLAGARAAGFGHGTDQALSTSLTASPNTHISNLAAVDLTKATIALRRMEQAQALEGEAIPDGKYSGWAARWAGGQDPRAYMIDLMNDEQRENLKKSLKTEAQRKKFEKSFQTAVEAGLIPRPEQ